MRAESMLINGAEIYFEVHGAGNPLLFLHGFTGRGGDWRFIDESLATGRQLIAPDLRGHGRSTNPLEHFTFRQAADDIVALLDLLGVERIKAIGLSGGGITLLHLATAHPARVEAMVLVSVPPYFPGEARAIMRAFTPESRTEAEWNDLRRRHAHGDLQIRKLLRQGQALADDFQDVSFTPPSLGRISADTLIVFGDRDPLYPVRLAFELYSSIPRAHLWVVPNGGHGPVFGEMAAPFARRALAFLDGKWARPDRKE